jgi:hypothetical protein
MIYCIAQHASEPHEVVMSMVGRVFLGLLMMFAVQSVAVAAWEPDSPDGWNARGVQYRKQGQNEKALDAFRRAHDMTASPRSVGQMGFVEHDLGQYVAAERHLNEALSAATDPWVTKNRLFLNEALQLVRKHLAHLTISGPPGAMVTVGGELAGVLPLAKPISLAEGRRSIEVTSAGFLPWRHEAVLAPGDNLELAADLIPERRDLPAAAPSKPGLPAATINDKISTESPHPTSANPGIRPAAWAAAGLTAALTVAAVVAYRESRDCGSRACNKVPQPAGYFWAFSGAAVGAAAGTVALFRW